MSRLLHHPETASDIWAKDELGIQGIGNQHQIVVSPWPVLVVNKAQPTSVQRHDPEYATSTPSRWSDFRLESQQPWAWGFSLTPYEAREPVLKILISGLLGPGPPLATGTTGSSAKC